MIAGTRLPSIVIDSLECMISGGARQRVDGHGPAFVIHGNPDRKPGDVKSRRPFRITRRLHRAQGRQMAQMIVTDAGKTISHKPEAGRFRKQQ